MKVKDKKSSSDQLPCNRTDRELCFVVQDLNCLALLTITVFACIARFTCTHVIFLIDLDTSPVMQAGTRIAEILHALIAVNSCLVAFVAKLARIGFAEIAF